PTWKEAGDRPWDRLSSEKRDEFQEIFDDLNSKIGLSGKGKMYEVDIPDDAKWIDWDFQPTEDVKKAFNELGVKPVDIPVKELGALYDRLREVNREYTDIGMELDSVDQSKAFFDPDGSAGSA